MTKQVQPSCLQAPASTQASTPRPAGSEGCRAGASRALARRADEFRAFSKANVEYHFRSRAAILAKYAMEETSEAPDNIKAVPMVHQNVRFSAPDAYVATNAPCRPAPQEGLTV